MTLLIKAVVRDTLFALIQARHQQTSFAQATLSWVSDVNNRFCTVSQSQSCAKSNTGYLAFE